MEENNSKPMTLQQKFVKLREAIPYIQKQKHSDSVKYTFAKIADVYKLLSPALNTHGVNFDIVGEKATRHDELGNAIFYHSYEQKTYNGFRLVWVYEADLTIRWTNADDPTDTLEVTLHAIGTNDGGPDKAKGSAWTYCLKYYLFEKFCIDQGDDDPDMVDRNNDQPAGAQKQPAEPKGGRGKQVPAHTAENTAGANVAGKASLTDAQIERMYKLGVDAGHDKAKIDARIAKKYGVDNPHKLSRHQYDEICSSLEYAIQGGK